MKNFNNTISPLLPSGSDEKENIPSDNQIKLYGYWQRRKEAWKRRKRQVSSPCRLGFTCLILLWSVLALVTTLLSYFRLMDLLQFGYDKFQSEGKR